MSVNHATAFSPIRPAKIEWQARTPFAAEYDDHYYSCDDGLAETRHVFIEGNRLSERFEAQQTGTHFVVAETGFGTGLNFLACWQQFLEHAPAGARLHFISVEKHPLQHTDLLLAHQHWPELSPFSAQLLANYPALAPGFHRRQFNDGKITLTLLFGDVLDMLSLLDASVDAWFLDGFAPSRNTAMWHQEVFDQIARLSHADTTLATFTAAGFVRRGLEQSGFSMQKSPGFGRKRDMLTGRARTLPARAVENGPAHVAVIGAGLAGCTLAAALAERGIKVTLFDAGPVAGGASGNHAGVVYTSASAHMTPQNRFYQCSYLYALATLKRHGFPDNEAGGRLNGVVQLAKDDRAADKAEAALASGFWPDDILVSGHTRGSQTLLTGGYLSPPRWCRYLIERHGPAHLQRDVVALSQIKSGWRLLDSSGDSHDVDQVVLCNAAGAEKLLPLPWLKLKSIRGQVSYVRCTEHSTEWPQAICHGGYLTPAIDNLHCVGATFDIGDEDTRLRNEDDHRNLQQLLRYLPEHWVKLGGNDAAIVGGRVGFRCQSTDFLPLAGSLEAAEENLKGLWLNIAHGSRGITGTPLCAELIASKMCHEPCPVDHDVSSALSPTRFLRRRNKRAQS